MADGVLTGGEGSAVVLVMKHASLDLWPGTCLIKSCCLKSKSESRAKFKETATVSFEDKKHIGYQKVILSGTRLTFGQCLVKINIVVEEVCRCKILLFMKKGIKEDPQLPNCGRTSCVRFNFKPLWRGIYRSA